MMLEKMTLVDLNVSIFVYRGTVFSEKRRKPSRHCGLVCGIHGCHVHCSPLSHILNPWSNRLFISLDAEHYSEVGIVSLDRFRKSHSSARFQTNEEIAH